MEIREMLGDMDINALESLRGNRLHVRAAGVTQGELEVLQARGEGVSTMTVTPPSTPLRRLTSVTVAQAIAPAVTWTSTAGQETTSVRS